MAAVLFAFSLLALIHVLAFLAYLDMRYVRKWNIDCSLGPIFRGEWSLGDWLKLPFWLAALAVLLPLWTIFIWSTDGQK